MWFSDPFALVSNSVDLITSNLCARDAHWLEGYASTSCAFCRHLMIAWSNAMPDMPLGKFRRWWSNAALVLTGVP